MADRFEDELEALFAAPPPVSDPHGFARSVDAALRRRRLVRRGALLAAGAAGAAVALGSPGALGLIERDPLARLLAEAPAFDLPAGAAGLGLWMAAGLVAAMAALIRNVEV
jgi:hypothetical protein